MVIDIIVCIADWLRTSQLNAFQILYVFINKLNLLFFNISSFRVITHDMYISQYKSGENKILRKDRTGYSSNLIYNDSIDDQKLVPFPLENVQLYRYKNLIINGDSDLLIDTKHNVVINNLCANKEERIIYHDSIKLAQKNKTILVRHNKKVTTIEKGIILSCNFSTNYYHALYDNLIRLVVLNDQLIPKDIPFVIDTATYNIQSLRRVFECLSDKQKRSHIIISPRKQYLIKDVYYVSHVNHIIPSIKSYDSCKPSDIIFDIDMTLMMRNALLSLKSNKVFSEKIFISRKQTSRRNFNEDAVFEILQTDGFERVFPENLPIEEQIALFNNAKVIVGGGGAALTNLMFCQARCKVLIISKTMAQIPCFTTVPYALGVQIRHYYHPNTDKRLHSNYVVNPKDVIDCLKRLEL